MRNPPDRNSYPSRDDAPPPNPGGRRARTIRDMFALDKPLRRLTSAPILRRRPHAPAGRGQGNPPVQYGVDPQGGPAQGPKVRWTEPGAYVERNRDSGPADGWRPDRGGPQDAYGAPYGDTRGEDRRVPSRVDYAEPASQPNNPGSETNLRWKRPDWLSKAPPPAMPPTDAAPPTTPRYPLDSPEPPRYQPVEREPKPNETDYRMTSARVKLWASRTPSYEPDRPIEVVERNTSEERAYFESYNTRRTPASLAHAQSSMAGGHPDIYTPGATSEVERLRRDEKARGRTNGPAPYFWEMVQKPRQASPLVVLAFWIISAFLVVSALLTSAYAGISIYAASQLVYAPQVAAKGTPADDKLAYQDVTFTSRTDHLLLRGWFIPGVVSPGHLTTTKTIIMAHGIRTNRADPGVGLLDLSAALAKHGFAVLAFDMRGSGESTSAPTSLGYFEQRDILGAVDFLRSGPMPYPNLGRPKAIGGWGVSMGAATMLMAAAQEPALRAIVSDSAYADVAPILQREIPARAHLPHSFTPGILQASQTMYGIDFYADNPVALVARIAPRPILFIHGAADTYVSPDNMTALAQAAQQGQGAHVQTWLVPNAKHAQAFHVAGQAYIDRVVAFFAANVTPAA